jgi:Asp-tRNA(Asn)/Glu-tRNA(Gln) amidotransferase A subunit family amidase
VIGLHRTDMWAEASAATQAAFAATAETLAAAGARLVDCDLPALAPLSPALLQLHMREMWDCLGYLLDEAPDRVSDDFKWIAGMALDIGESDYRAASETLRLGREAFATGMSGIDLLLTPSAKDVAPEGLAITGDPLFCRNWSGLGVPALGFPAAWREGLPIGLQFVGRAGSDRMLLATAGQLLADIGALAPLATMDHDTSTV